MLKYTMNCNVCKTATLELRNENSVLAKVVQNAAEEEFNVIGDLYVDQLYIKGQKVKLTEGLNDVELEAGVDNGEEAQGNVVAQRIITRDFILEGSAIVPLVRDVYVTFAYYSLEGGFYGMKDVEGDDTYVDPTVQEGDYEEGELYKVRVRILANEASMYMWGEMCEIVTWSVVTVAKRMYDNVYGWPNASEEPQYTNETSYQPLFDKGSKDYVMELYSWAFANSTFYSIVNVSVFVKEGEEYVKKMLVGPNNEFDYGQDVEIVSMETVPTLEYTSTGGMNTTVNISGEYDAYDEFLCKQAARKWTAVVKTNHSMVFNVKFETLEPGVLGSAGPTNFQYKNNRWYSIEGDITLNTLYWGNSKVNKKYNHKPYGYYTLLHEMGHIMGIGTLWLDHNLLSYGPWYTDPEWWNSNYAAALYVGGSGVREYKAYLVEKNLVSDVTRIQGMPVEEDGGAGTKGGHIEEGDENHNSRIFDGVVHAGMDTELMTGWSEETKYPEPMSRITVGMVEDLGYEVDYEEAE